MTEAPTSDLKEAQQNPDRTYAWKPERALEQYPTRAADTWLRYQAQSILGRKVYLDEAQRLFKKIDINTRQPIPDPKPTIKQRLTRVWDKIRGRASK